MKTDIVPIIAFYAIATLAWVVARFMPVEAPDGIFFLFLVIMIFSIGVATLRLMALIGRL